MSSKILVDKEYYENKISELNALQKRVKRKSAFYLTTVSLLVLISATLAWFTLNTFVTVDPLRLNVTTGVDLRVAMDDLGTDISLYEKTITNEMINQYLARQNSSLTNMLLDPVTSRDGRTFTYESGAAATPNRDSYLEFECYFIASKEMWVHLSTDDTDIDSDDGTRVTTTETGAKAEVVQCVRVDFTSDDDGTAVYEPNKGAQLVAGLPTFDLTDPMVYSDDTRLFHLDEFTPTKVTIRLWVDGEDNECDDDVQTSALDVQLLFSGTDVNNVPFT